mgnify:CR=1 FL=1
MARYQPQDQEQEKLRGAQPHQNENAPKVGLLDVKLPHKGPGSGQHHGVIQPAQIGPGQLLEKDQGGEDQGGGSDGEARVELPLGGSDCLLYTSPSPRDA